MTFLELKPLTAPEQLPLVVELDQLCLGGIWTLDGYRRELESPNSDLLVLSIPVTEISHAPCPMPHAPFFLGLGCLWAILEEAHITLLGVHPNYRRQGLGQLLLLALLQSAKKRQLEWATLEVRASNQEALSLYRKLEFQEVGRRRHYYKDTGEDALILWRNGLQDPKFEQTLEEFHRQVFNRLATFGWQLKDSCDLFTNSSVISSQ